MDAANFVSVGLRSHQCAASAAPPALLLPLATVQRKSLCHWEAPGRAGACGFIVVFKHFVVKMLMLSLPAAQQCCSSLAGPVSITVRLFQPDFLQAVPEVSSGDPSPSAWLPLLL